MPLSPIESQELQIAAKELEFAPYYDPAAPDDRLKNALALVQTEAVSPEGTDYLVKGRTRTYKVGETCSCEDATKRKNANCYHKVAIKLYQHWRQRLGEKPMADTYVEEPTLPLPQDQQPAQRQDTAKAIAILDDFMQDLARLPLPMGRMLRPLHAILADLRKPLPDECIPSFPGPGKTEIDFLPWRHITHLLHIYAPGWYPEVVRIDEMEVLTIVVRVNILSAEGCTGYEGVGRDEQKMGEKQYGDRPRRAYARALKHAAQLMGMDWLQEDADKSQTLTALDKYLLNEQMERIKALDAACEKAGLDRRAYKAALMQQAGVTSGRHIPVAMLQEALVCVEGWAASKKE